MCGDFCNGIGFYVMLTEVKIVVKIVGKIVKIVMLTEVTTTIFFCKSLQAPALISLYVANFRHLPCSFMVLFRHLLFSRLCFHLERIQIHWATYVLFPFSAGIIFLLSRYYISSKNASHTSLGQQAKMNPYWPVLCPRSLYGFACGAVSDYLINSGRISRLDMQKVSYECTC